MAAERTTLPAADGTQVDAALRRWDDLAPWFAWFTGPVAALTQLTLAFVLQPTAHDLGSKALLYAISAALLIATGLAALACARGYERARFLSRGQRSALRDRAEMLGLGGVLLNAFSLLALLAQIVPIIALGLGD